MANYETRTVTMWLNNDEDSYHSALEIVERNGNIWDAADELEERISAVVDLYADAGMSGVLVELLRSTLREVDWEEVARDFKPDAWGDADEEPEEEEDEDA